MFSLTRRDAINDMLSLHEAMNQLFANSFVNSNWKVSDNQPFVPALDLSETEDAFFVDVTVPGFKAEDLDITVENNVLTITGEIKRENENQERTYHVRECYSNRFQRAVRLPNTVRPDAIQASLTEGILHLVVPKAEETKPRRINVQVGEKNLTA